MAEDRARLQQLFAELRTQLSASTSIDGETRRRLEATILDTERALAGQPPTQPTSKTLSERLAAVAAEGQGTVVSYNYAEGRKAPLTEELLRRIRQLEATAKTPRS